MWRIAAMFRSLRLWCLIALLGCAAFFFIYNRPGQILAGRKSLFYENEKDTDMNKVTKERPTPSRKAPPTTKPTTRRPTTKPTTRRPTTTTRKPTTKAPPILTVVRIPNSDKLNEMTDLQLHRLYHSYINSPQVPCSAVERMGKITDGGWEICDDPLYRPPNKNECLVYSFGISYDFSFDDDMAEYGCEVHSFDPSMGNTADHLRGKRVHFHNKGLGDKDGALTQGPNGAPWTLFSLKGFREMLGHEVGKRRIDILKMDIEGHEQESLTQALKDGSLSDVRQLSFETHVTWGPEPRRDQYIKFLELLRGVYDAGFRIYITHRNYVYSAFESRLTGKWRAKCHEVHTVNIRLRQKPQPHGLQRQHDEPQRQPQQHKVQPQQLGIQHQQFQGQRQQFQGQPQQPQGEPELLQGQPQQPQGEPELLHGQPQQPQGDPELLQGEPELIEGQPQQPQGDPEVFQGEPELLQGQPQKLQGRPELPHGQPQLPQGQPQQPQGQPKQPQRQSQQLQWQP